jgi:hypothetical protein
MGFGMDEGVSSGRDGALRRPRRVQRRNKRGRTLTCEDSTRAVTAVAAPLAMRAVPTIRKIKIDV